MIHTNPIAVGQQISRVAIAVVLLIGVAGAAEPQPLMVKAKAKPAQEWKEYPTRTVEMLPGFKPGSRPVALDKFGGRADRKMEAKGFFYATKIGPRWWLVDPEGGLFIHVGVASVTPGSSQAVKAAFKDRFGSDEQWAQKTAEMLRENGFNGAGGWSDTKFLPKAQPPIVYTMIWNFMSSFGKSKKLTHPVPGHAGYPNDCIPVFHPDFPAFCDELAKGMAATKDDPWLLGHFSDNEMPMPQLDKFMALDTSNPDMASSQKAAQDWLNQRKGNQGGATKADITNEDRDAFVGYGFGKYMEITTAAIRKYDPNHMCLGPRYHGAEKQKAPAWQAAGKYLDAIAVNYYNAWTPDQKLVRNWGAWSGKPFIVTEFYTKGMDSGFPNTTGAGWVVPTQKDRGLFYQNYTLGLLESQCCVGWHWFKYQDNDPNDLKAELSNRDSNKGIVNIKYEPYPALLEAMKQLNQNVYQVTDYFDLTGAMP